jgi:hypothetical protein
MVRWAYMVLFFGYKVLWVHVANRPASTTRPTWSSIFGKSSCGLHDQQACIGEQAYMVRQAYMVPYTYMIAGLTGPPYLHGPLGLEVYMEHQACMVL